MNIMPPMTSVLHIVDASTSEDCLEQLQLLVGESDLVVSIGPPPDSAVFTHPVHTIHCSLGIPGLVGLWDRRIPQATVVHAWSYQAIQLADSMTLSRHDRLVFSLSHPPDAKTRDNLRYRLRLGELVLTVPSHAMRKTFLEMGVPEESIHVLPTPALPASPDPSRRQAVRKAIGIAADDILLISPAPIVAQAGHKYAIWAHAIVRQIHPHLRLLIPGDGPAMNHVRFFAGTTGYDNEIHLVERRFSRADALAAADIALLMYEDSCGLSALAQTMYAGVPIVAAATPEVTECLVDGESALLAQPGSPRANSARLLQMVDDPELGKRLARSAAETAGRRFSLAAARGVLRDIYATLL